LAVEPGRELGEKSKNSSAIREAKYKEKKKRMKVIKSVCS